jgi:hypothetical protein
MTRRHTVLGITVLAALGLGACGQQGETHHMMEGEQHAAPAGEGHAHGPAHAHDSNMMERHGAEATQMGQRVREHLKQVRKFSADEQYARIGEHASLVGQMLSMMDRHMREMGMHGGQDGHDGHMMGHGHGGHGGHGHEGHMMMGAEDHDRMMAEMRTLRAEVETLQTAAAGEVARVMPAHLDRLEGMLPMLEQCASHAHHS